MKILWEQTAWDDYQFWIDNDKNILRKVNGLIKECQRTPFEGTGKPEPLRQNLSGYWSRRITGEHRLIYKVENDVLTIIQCRFHY